MNAFSAATAVDAEAWIVLKPYLDKLSDNRIVLLNKGPLAKLLQEKQGDAIMEAANTGNVISIELKTEEKHTGNLFLEAWSNKCLENYQYWRSNGLNPGWMLKANADYIFYYFLNTDDLYIIRTIALQRWAFGYTGDKKEHQANIYRYKEKPQNKYSQLNKTTGWIVPIADIVDGIRKHITHVKVKQLSLPGMEKKIHGIQEPSPVYSVGGSHA